jgi:hypothetical protein
MRSVFITICFLAGPLAAQSATPADSLVTATAKGVGATFKYPARWHVIQEDLKDSAAVFIYHIRNPATDSNSDDRANVVVVIARARIPKDFKAFTDTLMSGQFDQSTTILGDTMWTPDRRTIFWRAQRKETPYAGYDHLSRSGGRWVHVRFVMPLVTATPPEWAERTLSDVNAMMWSIRAGGAAFFGARAHRSTATAPPSR